MSCFSPTPNLQHRRRKQLGAFTAGSPVSQSGGRGGGPPKVRGRNAADYSGVWLRWSQTRTVPSPEEAVSAQPNWKYLSQEKLSIYDKSDLNIEMNKVPNVFLQDTFTYYNTGRHSILDTTAQ